MALPGTRLFPLLMGLPQRRGLGTTSTRLTFTPKTLKNWDEQRVRSVRIDLSSTETTDAPDSELTAKSIKFKFYSDADIPGAVGEMWRKWKIVGFVLFYADHGLRAEGTDVVDA